MMAWLFFGLAILLFFLWRTAAADAAYWERLADAYREQLYAEWDKQREWIKREQDRLDRDDADWWKG